MKTLIKALLRVIPIVFIFVTPILAHAQDVSIAPSVEDISILNNIGKSDAITVENLCAGDTIKVYKSESGGGSIGSATIKSTYSSTGIVYIQQIGSKSGSIYISNTSKGLSESARTKVDFDGEPQSEILSASNVIITNNSGKPDTIEIAGLIDGETVKVYNSLTKGKLLGSGTKQSAKQSLIINISQLGTSAGSAFLTTSSKNMLESDRIEVSYESEQSSDAICAEYVNIANNAADNDVVSISGLSGGDEIKIYRALTGGKAISDVKVPAGKFETIIKIPQLGIQAGSVYISITSTNMLESNRVEIDYDAEPESYPVENSDVIVTNNAGAADTVYISNLLENDVIKVYDLSTAGKLLGKGTVLAKKNDVTINVGRLSTNGGSVFVSVANDKKRESTRTEVNYAPEQISYVTESSNVNIQNNVGAADTIKVSELLSGDVIKVYNAQTGGVVLGTATVTGSNTDATVSISQLGKASGIIYISVTSSKKQESTRTPMAYLAEANSVSTNSASITVTNRVGSADTVRITNLLAKDVIKVYDAQTSGSLLGSATVSDGNTDATVTIPQLGTEAGSVYVSITSAGKKESDRIKVTYSAEDGSPSLDVDNIDVANNFGSSDTIKVYSILPGDVIKVYDSETVGNLLGSGTVAASNSDVVITVSQLGTNAGSVYVSLTRQNRKEGSRTKVNYLAEAKTDTISSQNIYIYNNSSTADSIKILGLQSNDVVKIYDASKGGNKIASATVANSATSIEVPVTQLGTAAGSVYITITSLNKQESERVQADYSAEGKTTAPLNDNIIVKNNSGASDTVKVTGLNSGDVVYIYNAQNAGTLLASGTVSPLGTELTMSISQLGTSSGSIYVSVRSTSKQESDRTEVDYSSESASNAPLPENVDVKNNVGIASSITVTGLLENDLVKIYDSETGGTIIGSATVPAYNTKVVVSLSSLSENGGNLYISVSSSGKIESTRTKITYSAKLSSQAPFTEDVTIQNNVGISDTITVNYLSSGDVVNVYNAAVSGTVFGTATTTGSSMQVIIYVAQLGVNSGKVYVSVTSKGKTESSRTAVNFPAEGSSSAPDENNVIIVNNNSDSVDTITIYGVVGGDTVKVYNAIDSRGSLISQGTVPTSSSLLTLTVQQLGIASGSVYITVTNAGKSESARTKIDYAAESSAPLVSSITITNNASIADTIVVSGLNNGDYVKVYDTSKAGHLLGSAMVQNSTGTAKVSIQQLGTDSGSVYISITSLGKCESGRTKCDFAGEQTSSEVLLKNTTATNNGDGSYTITLNGLTSDDLILVYDSLSGTNLLGYGSVLTGSTKTIITIVPQSTNVQAVYVSLTSMGMYEGSRTRIWLPNQLQPLSSSLSQQ